MTKSSADFKANVGNMEFDIKPLGQKLFIPFTPFSYELSPKAVFTGLTKDPRYTDFIYAILERINLEKAIDKDDQIDDEFIRNHSILFNKLFPFMPKLNDLECDLKKWDLKKYKKFISKLGLTDLILYKVLKKCSKNCKGCKLPEGGKGGKKLLREGIAPFAP